MKPAARSRVDRQDMLLSSSSRCLLHGAVWVSLALSSCGPEERSLPAFPTDSGREQPIFAVWTESFSEPDGGVGKRLILAVWKNGDVVWRRTLKPSSAELVQASLPEVEAVATKEHIRSSMQSFEDAPDHPCMPDIPAMVLGFTDESGAHRISTFHTMAPDLPTLLRTRFHHIVVTPESRETFARRLPEEVRFTAVWDAEMVKLEEVLAHAAPANGIARDVCWPERK